MRLVGVMEGNLICQMGPPMMTHPRKYLGGGGGGGCNVGGIKVEELK